MKKTIKAIFIINMVICLTSSGIINAAPKTKPRPISEATMLGQQLVKELNDNIKKANETFKGTIGLERENAEKDARDAAQNLTNALNDIKTFGTDIIRGYNPKQIQIAAITLAELITRLHRLKLEIKAKRLEVADMTDVGMIVDSALPGKEAQRSQAMKDQQYNHKEKSDIRKAMDAQKEILGTKWSDIITLVTYNLLIGSSLGICYDIDWSFGAHTAQILESGQTVNKPRLATRSKQKLTKRQHAAIKSWYRLSKSELLTKEISSTQQVVQANDLLKKLQDVQDDLKDVPPIAKYKNIAHEVNKAVTSLSQKIDVAKTRWLKIV